MIRSDRKRTIKAHARTIKARIKSPDFFLSIILLVNSFTRVSPTRGVGKFAPPFSKNFDFPAEILLENRGVSSGVSRT